MIRLDVLPGELLEELIIIAECDDVIEAVCQACVLGIEYRESIE